MLNLPIELALLSSFSAGQVPQLVAELSYWFCGCLGPGHWHIPRRCAKELLGWASISLGYSREVAADMDRASTRVPAERLGSTQF